MWISKKKYDLLTERIRNLEAATYVRCAPHGVEIGAVVRQIMDHLGVHIERQLQYDRLVKKGGPEKPSDE